MILIRGEATTDPYYHAALEEYCLRQLPHEEAVVLLYVNDTAVVVGRNQNIFEETDPDYLHTHNIQLVRRLSGGGTVYHDAGNLNFSFIVPGREDIHRFEKFTAPIVRVLAKFGINTTMHTNGSLFVGDNKISGHAQYVAANRLISHGTLLFAADLDKLSPALRPKVTPVESNGVASIRSPVINLRPLLPAPMQLADLQTAILQELFDDDLQTYELSPAEETAVQELAESKYKSWEWTYARNPRFVLERDGRCPKGDFTIRLQVKNGRVHNLALTCAFSPEKDPAHLSTQLRGTPYNSHDLHNILQTIDLTPYFGTLSTNKALKYLC